MFQQGEKLQQWWLHARRGQATTEGQNDEELGIKSHVEGPGGQGPGQDSTTSRQACRVLNCVL